MRYNVRKSKERKGLYAISLGQTEIKWYVTKEHAQKAIIAFQAEKMISRGAPYALYHDALIHEEI